MFLLQEARTYCVRLQGQRTSSWLIYSQVDSLFVFTCCIRILTVRRSAGTALSLPDTEPRYFCWIFHDRCHCTLCCLWISLALDLRLGCHSPHDTRSLCHLTASHSSRPVLHLHCQWLSPSRLSYRQHHSPI